MIIKFLAGSMAKVSMLSALVEMKNVRKHYPVGGRIFSRAKKLVHAVDVVTLDVEKGQILGLVGESGCGKTTLGMLCLGLIDLTTGTIKFDSKDISRFDKDQMKSFRKAAQIIFQDPYGSLNPRKTVSQILSVPYALHKTVERDEVGSRIQELLDLVGLSPAETYIERYPFELSGGQRQRVNIARAIATNPRFIVADEPVSSLDVSVRAQIINLFKRLQKEHGLTCIYVTHDLAIGRSICGKVAIMYLGEIVELAEAKVLYENPCHPYTNSLFSAVPFPDPKKTRRRKRTVLRGEVPSAINLPQGCRFHGRCVRAVHECSNVKPELVEVAKGHLVRCLKL